MSTVTLVAPEHAEPGTEFVFRGAAPGCDGCPYRAQCLDLAAGVRYRVTERRDGGQPLDCAVHEAGEVVAVEVEPAPVRTTVPRRQAYAGSTAAPVGGCPHTDCPSHGDCVPTGATPDDQRPVETVHGETAHEAAGVECALGRDLALVELAAVDE